MFLAGTIETKRAFFERFSARQGRVQAPARPSYDTTDSPANRVAEDWAKITQQGSTKADARAEFFKLIPDREVKVNLRSLDEDTTVDEVRDALRSCPQGKAAGPDGLPNDWYRDQENTLPKC